MKRPIYIARPLIGAAIEGLTRLAHQYGLEVEPDPHVTVAYSADPVDWSNSVFSPMTDTVQVSSQGANFERFGDCIVLVFQSEEIHERHRAFRLAGASWDFPIYNSHVTIGYDRQGLLEGLPDLSEAPSTLEFGCEYKEELIPKPQKDDTLEP